MELWNYVETQGTGGRCEHAPPADVECACLTSNSLFRRLLVPAILLLTLFIPLILFNGSIDDFAPKHMVIIEDISKSGYMSDNYYTRQVPGFYIISSIIQIVTGLLSKDLLFIPIELIPYTLLFYILMNKLFDNPLLSSILAFIELISGTTGTAKVFLWPHGLGYILFYTILSLIIMLCEEQSHRTKELKLLLILSISSIIYLSYNLSGMLLLLISILLLLQNALSLNIYKGKINFKTKNLSHKLLFIAITLELGLCNFFYKTFLPIIKDSNYIELSSIDKFLWSYIFPINNDANLSGVYLTYPSIISIISAMKYVILLLSIIFFLFLVISKVSNTRSISFNDIFTLSLLLMSFIYAIGRSFIGGIVITFLYLPGIVSTIWLHRYGSIYRKWASIVIVLLLFLIPAYYLANYHYNLINKDPHQFSNIEQPTYWLVKNAGQQKITSDELTKNYIMLYDAISPRPSINMSLSRMMTSDVLALLHKTCDINSQKLFVINYNLNTMCLNNWVNIKSWKYSRNIIERNTALTKIYLGSNISIYSSTE